MRAEGKAQRVPECAVIFQGNRFGRKSQGKLFGPIANHSPSHPLPPGSTSLAPWIDRARIANDDISGFRAQGNFSPVQMLRHQSDAVESYTRPFLDNRGLGAWLGTESRLQSCMYSLPQGSRLELNKGNHPARHGTRPSLNIGSRPGPQSEGSRFLIRGFHPKSRYGICRADVHGLRKAAIHQHAAALRDQMPSQLPL